MTQYLPPNLLALFAPRDSIPFLPPPDKLPHEKKTRGYLGVGAFLPNFEVNINLAKKKGKENFLIILKHEYKLLYFAVI